MEAIAKYRRLTSNQLKLIAIIAMVVDHVAIVFVPHNTIIWQLMRVIGRLTAPLMCYFIAEGYYHTSNLKKYMGRLLLMAVISHIPHSLCMGDNIWKFWRATDVMFALLFGLIALAACKSEKIPLLGKGLIVILCCLLSYSADWNYVAVFYIVGIGLFHGDIRKQILAFCAVSCGYVAQAFVYSTTAPWYLRLGVFLVVPLLLLYSGQRGKKCNLIKWGFYWFYPIHLLLIYFIAQLVK